MHHEWAEPDRREYLRLQALRRIRRLRAAELRAMLWHDGLSASLGMNPPALVCWAMIRRLVRQRCVAFYWYGLVVERACAKGGNARAQDIEAWGSL